MVAISTEHLLLLARTYSEVMGVALSTTGARACGKHNRKSFTRLADGGGIHSRTITRAVEWFAANWPAHVEWPRGVPGKARQGGSMPRVPRAEDSNHIEIATVQGRPRMSRLRLDWVVPSAVAHEIALLVFKAKESDPPLDEKGES